MKLKNTLESITLRMRLTASVAGQCYWGDYQDDSTEANDTIRAEVVNTNLPIHTQLHRRGISNHSHRACWSFFINHHSHCHVTAGQLPQKALFPFVRLVRRCYEREGGPNKLHRELHVLVRVQGVHGFVCAVTVHHTPPGIPPLARK